MGGKLCGIRLRLRCLEETFQLPDSGRVAHLTKRLGFNLTDPLPRHPKLPSYFFQSPAVAVNKAKSLLQHLPLAVGQRLEHILDLLFQEDDRSHVAWIFRALVLDEVAEIRFLAFANGRLE